MLDINMADVIQILGTIAPYLICFGVVLVLSIIAMIACRKMTAEKKYLIRSQSGIAILLVLLLVVNLICFGPMSTILSLATGSGTIDDETAEQAQALAEEIAGEGIVMLKNTDGMLPLDGESALNVFGWASANPNYGGTGSGGLNQNYHTVTLLEGLENAGFKVNSELVDFYNGFRQGRPAVMMLVQDWTLPEPTVDSYSADLLNNAKAFSDKAMIVITRVGGENADLPQDVSKVKYENNSTDYDDFPTGEHYLQLSQTERNMVEMVCKNFDDVVLVYNSSNVLELGFVEEFPQIKSVLWCAGPGQNGFNALGKLLKGEINPSGRNSDTFLYEMEVAPWWNNFGDFTYTNMSEYEAFYIDTIARDMGFGGDGRVTPHFVNYVESIYVGYKFYETAAAEGFLDYDKTVQYPFGYGLSYTTFDQKMGELKVSGDTISFDVTVTNTGNTAGKDVVQVYYNPPYYNGGIEKASANLIAFEKTNLLEPGSSQTITVSFNTEDMASYDERGTGCYVLEHGDYIISINTDSHTVIDEKVYTVNSDISYSDGRSTDKTPAVNQFDAAGSLTYLSRTDSFANYDEATAAPTYEMEESYKKGFYNADTYVATDFNNDADEMPVTGAKNGLKLVDLRGADFDDPRWNDLLDQLTVGEMCSLISVGGFQTGTAASVGKISTVDCDGPASINNNFTGVGSVGFPAGTMIASTWNTELAAALGDSIGKMADEMGVSGWYAPATNMHRSAFAGRNFEYYSEDALLAGKMAANASKAAEAHGVYAYIKHFALNDQESNRWSMVCTWSTEQAIREIYLKPFEIAIKEGGASAVMSSYNYIGNTWAGGCNALMTKVLRDEWGFNGMAISDYFGGYGFMHAEEAFRNGTDLMLASFVSDINTIHDTSSATSIKAMRQAVKHIFYTVVNSRAYSDENLHPELETWKVIAYAVDAIVVLVVVTFELTVIRKGYSHRKAKT